VTSFSHHADSDDDTLFSAAAFFRTFGISCLFNCSAGAGKGIPHARVLHFLFVLVFLWKTFFDTSLTDRSSGNAEVGNLRRDGVEGSFFGADVRVMLIRKTPGFLKKRMGVLSAFSLSSHRFRVFNILRKLTSEYS
jgi:hypothetical protein